jgi:hypothetical protein
VIAVALACLAGVGAERGLAQQPGASSGNERVSIVMDPSLGAAPGDQYGWVGYAGFLRTWLEEEGLVEYLRPGDFIPTPAAELFARERAAKVWAYLKANQAVASPYWDALEKVEKAGFLREYVWLRLRRPGWGPPPADLRADAFAQWASEHLPGHVPQTRAGVRLLPAAAVGGAYTHRGTRLRFPFEVGEFRRIDLLLYPDDRLGVSIGYRLSDFGTLTLYLYDLGIPDIPDGPDSMLAGQAFDGAERDVVRGASERFGGGFGRVSADGATLPPRAAVPGFRMGAYEYPFSGKSGTPDISWLLVTGVRGKFLKIRYSCPATRREDCARSLDAFLAALFELNGPPQ